MLFVPARVLWIRTSPTLWQSFSNLLIIPKLFASASLPFSSFFCVYRVRCDYVWIGILFSQNIGWWDSWQECLSCLVLSFTSVLCRVAYPFALPTYLPYLSIIDRVRPCWLSDPEPHYEPLHCPSLPLHHGKKKSPDWGRLDISFIIIGYFWAS